MPLWCKCCNHIGYFCSNPIWIVWCCVSELCTQTPGTADMVRNNYPGWEQRTNAQVPWLCWDPSAVAIGHGSVEQVHTTGVKSTWKQGKPGDYTSGILSSATAAKKWAWSNCIPLLWVLERAVTQCHRATFADGLASASKQVSYKISNACVVSKIWWLVGVLALWWILKGHG